jgi:uncharacterized protein YcfJ
MPRLTIRMLTMGIAAALALSVAACNRQADSGVNGASATAPAGDATQAGQQQQAEQGGAAGAQYAQVVSVTPVRQIANGTQQVCHDEVVTHRVQPQDQHRIAGTAIGAVAGGLLGHLVGHGKGNTLATVAGAVGGGYAGNRIEENRQNSHVVSSVVQRCQAVDAANSPIVGYDVSYVFNGVTRTTRMDHDPGDRLLMQ